MLPGKWIPITNAINTNFLRSPLFLEFVPSSWSNDFNSNKSKETSPRHLGRLHCSLPRSAKTLPRVKCWTLAQQLSEEVPTSYPQKSLHLLLEGRFSQLSPLWGSTETSRASRGCLGKSLPEALLASSLGLTPPLLVGPEQGVSGSEDRTPSKLKGRWSTRMPSPMPAGSQGCGGRWGVKGRMAVFSLAGTRVTESMLWNRQQHLEDTISKVFDLTQHILRAHRYPWSSPGNLPHGDYLRSYDRVVKREKKRKWKQVRGRRNDWFKATRPSNGMSQPGDTCCASSTISLLQSEILAEQRADKSTKNELH